MIQKKKKNKCSTLNCDGKGNSRYELAKTHHSIESCPNKKKIEQSNQTRESYSNELKVIQLENQNKELESRIGDYQTEIMSLKNSIVFKKVGFKKFLLCTNTLLKTKKNISAVK